MRQFGGRGGFQTRPYKVESRVALSCSQQMYGPEKHHRKSIRLRDYDYMQARAYFVTVCTHDAVRIFGAVVDGHMVLSDAGRIVQGCWDDLPYHYSHVQLDAFVIMPNHVHGIIMLMDHVGAGFKPAPTESTLLRRHGLPEIIRAFKTFSSRCINQLRRTSGTPVWQRNYYEHIIRNDDDLHEVRRYIDDNPARWAEDEYYKV
jgi:putative transposase